MVGDTLNDLHANLFLDAYIEELMMALDLNHLIHFFSSSVCDEFCKEAVMDPANMLWVCQISGHCFDNVMSPQEAKSDSVSGNLLYIAILIVILQLYKIKYNTSFTHDILIMMNKEPYQP